MKTLYWLSKKYCNSINFVKFQNKFAIKIKNRSANYISEKVSYIGVKEHVSFVSEIFCKLKISLNGTGMEMGAGASIFSNSLLKIFPRINKIYAVEIVPEQVFKLIPKICSYNKSQNKVIPVLGSYDNIKLKKNSLDFIVEWDSFHHSQNLEKTLREAYRVLKSSGTLIMVDRFHFNLSSSQVDFLENIEYSKAYKATHGHKSNIRFTRKDNTEHEILLREWKSLFNKIGFTLNTIATFQKKNFKIFVKALVSLIPFKIRYSLKFYPHLTIDWMYIFYYLMPSFKSFKYDKSLCLFFPLVTNFRSKEAPIRKSVLVVSKQ